MADRLDGCRVAILVTDGFEEVELTKPRQALDDAGAEWVDEPSVTDGNLTTSRNPDDIPQFNEAMIGLFARQRTPESA